MMQTTWSAGVRRRVAGGWLRKWARKPKEANGVADLKIPINAL